MMWLRVVWAGLKHDRYNWRTPQAEGYLPAFDPTVPKGFAPYEDGSGSGQRVGRAAYRRADRAPDPRVSHGSPADEARPEELDLQGTSQIDAVSLGSNRQDTLLHSPATPRWR